MHHDSMKSDIALKDCMRLVTPSGFNQSILVKAWFSNLNAPGVVGNVDVTFVQPHSDLPHIECPTNIMKGFRVNHSYFTPLRDTFSFDEQKRELQISGTVKATGEPFNFVLRF